MAFNDAAAINGPSLVADLGEATAAESTGHTEIPVLLGESTTEEPDSTEEEENDPLKYTPAVVSLPHLTVLVTFPVLQEEEAGKAHAKATADKVMAHEEKYGKTELYLREEQQANFEEGERVAKHDVTLLTAVMLLTDVQERELLR